jgi:AcrR family transcriptional regulator
MSPRTKAQFSQLRAERRNQILQAASIVFSRVGFHAANVSDVAAEARVSQGTIYHYFKSKEELFMAAFEAWETESFYQEVQAATDGTASAAEQLRQLAYGIGERMAQSVEILPASVEFWSHIYRNTAIRESFRLIFSGLRTTLAELIQGGIAQGEFVPIDSNAVATLLISIYDGLILQWLADPQSVDWQTESTTLVDLVFHGLLKTPEKS